MTVTADMIRAIEKGMTFCLLLDHLVMNTTDDLREGYRQLNNLPNIHKNAIPYRPICSSVNHTTRKISKLVDDHIKGYILKIQSYIRDNQDFISKIKYVGKILKEPCCAVSLYPLSTIVYPIIRGC